jgi:beta-lactamase class C
MRLLTSALGIVLMVGSMTTTHAQINADVQRVVTRHVKDILPADGLGGVAVALRSGGRTAFFNYGWADASNERPVTSDTLFNIASIRKVFEATVLARAAQGGKLSLDEPVADLVPELKLGGDIRRVTLGQLATHTSGLLLPQDHPPWPDWGYTLPEFIRALNGWEADIDHQPGEQQMYTHAGYVLLALALERRLGRSAEHVIGDQILRPLGLSSTTLPLASGAERGHLAPEQKRRAAQGYGEGGEPIGGLGDQQGYYHWAGNSQMYSSARDLAVFLTANMGELPIEPPLHNAMEMAQRGVFAMSPHNTQALAWEISHGEGEPEIVEKYGGLNNASSYIALMPGRALGIVILTNRGNQYPNETGRRILLELAGAAQTSSDK